MSLARRPAAEGDSRGMAQGRLQNDRVLAFGRQERERAVGGLVPFAMSEPGRGIPPADPSRKSRSSSGSAVVALGDAGSTRSRRAASRRARSGRGRSSAPCVEVSGFGVRQGPPLQDQIWPFAHPVDRVNARVEPLQVVRAVDKRPLPAPFEIEVIDRRIAKIEGKRPVFEAGEDRISRCRKRF